MKLKYLGIFVIILISVSENECFTQESEFGIEFGYGKTYKDRYRSSLLVSPFDNKHDDYLRIGLRYNYTFPKALFNVNSGLLYENRDYHYGKSAYLSVPIGLSIQLGGKAYFIGGIGLFINYLLSFDTDYYETIVAINNFKLGWYVNTGVGYQISQRYSVNIQYQNNFDITRMYEKVHGSPGGSGMADVRGFDGFLSICLRYKLSIH